MNRDGFTPHDSDHIDGSKHNTFTRRMTVRFKNGSEYVVHGVSGDTYRDFLNAPSQGEHFHTVIKPSYPIERKK